MTAFDLAGRERLLTDPPEWELFSAGFQRCFGRVYAYVSRRVDDAKRRERIVSEVLAENLDLVVGPRDDRQDFRRLKATADRLIAAP